MYTAPSPPAHAPGYLLPEGAHALLLEVGDVMQRLAALAATEQANHDLTAHLLCQPGVLAQCPCASMSPCASAAVWPNPPATRRRPREPPPRIRRLNCQAAGPPRCAHTGASATRRVAAPAIARPPIRSAPHPPRQPGRAPPPTPAPAMHRQLHPLRRRLRPWRRPGGSASAAQRPVAGAAWLRHRAKVRITAQEGRLVIEPQV